MVCNDIMGKMSLVFSCIVRHIPIVLVAMGLGARMPGFVLFPVGVLQCRFRCLDATKRSFVLSVAAPCISILMGTMGLGASMPDFVLFAR